jgi:hypothetical protein
VARTIVDKVFEVHCQCDRCGLKHVRESTGDIHLPVGWSYLHVSVYSNHHEGALLCASCVALVLAAAAPARLVVDSDNGMGAQSSEL